MLARSHWKMSNALLPYILSAFKNVLEDSSVGCCYESIMINACKCFAGLIFKIRSSSDFVDIQNV